MTSPSLTFLGAAGTVTGSRFLLDGPDGRVLVDCGLFQGIRPLRRRNWEPFGVPGASIRSVVLTHAHLDHSGWLPVLCRQGFSGPVHLSARTAELLPMLLHDSAHLQEEDAEAARRGGWSRHERPEPLYRGADVDRALRLLRPTPLDTRVDVPGASLLLRTAGHILGATTARLDVGGRRVLFSGDLGRVGHPLLRPPAPPAAADVVVVESTYGGRTHPTDVLDRIAATCRRTVARGGVVLIPAFAVDRTAVVLWALRTLMTEGRIPRVPVYVDSPMALAALAVYRDAARAGDPEVAPEICAQAAAGIDPFDPGTLVELPSASESAAINSPREPAIIVSASGMASGGRIVHHLDALLPDERNTVLLVGFQAAGTRGARLLAGEPALKMFGRYVPVRAEVVDATGLSAHADADGLLAWLADLPDEPSTVYVVHGEEEQSAGLAHRIRTELGWTAVAPTLGERVLI